MQERNDESSGPPVPGISTNDLPAILQLKVSSADTTPGDAQSIIGIRARLIIDYLKVLTWPILIVGLLAVYRPPLGRMLDSLASKFEAANTVTIGSFSLAVQEKARDLGGPELGREIGQLSVKAIEALMRTPAFGSMVLISANDHSSPPEYGLPGDAELEGLIELEKKGLVTFEEPLESFVKELKSKGRSLEKDSRMRTDDRQWLVFEGPNTVIVERVRNQRYQLTEKGKKAVEAITKAVGAQLTRPE